MQDGTDRLPYNIWLGLKYGLILTKKKKTHILINLKKEQNTRSSHRLLGKVRITN